MSTHDCKAVIVTGSSRGIGRAIAEKLAADGFAITVNYTGNAAAADEVVTQIMSAGGRAIAVQGDVSRTDDVIRLFDETERAFGGVHGLVNNAGVLTMKALADTDDETFDRTLAINVRGPFLTLREAARRLQSGGRIVNLSTSATPMALPGYATYCATKAAVEVFTSILAKELRGRQITVNAVAPGPVATELFFEGKSPETVDRMAKMNPFERLGEPRDVANVVSFLFSPEAGWVNAQTIRANGGMI